MLDSKTSDKANVECSKASVKGFSVHSRVILATATAVCAMMTAWIMVGVAGARVYGPFVAPPRIGASAHLMVGCVLTSMICGLLTLWLAHIFYQIDRKALATSVAVWGVASVPVVYGVSKLSSSFQEAAQDAMILVQSEDMPVQLMTKIHSSGNIMYVDTTHGRHAIVVSVYDPDAVARMVQSLKSAGFTVERVR